MGCAHVEATVPGVQSVAVKDKGQGMSSAGTGKGDKEQGNGAGVNSSSGGTNHTERLVAERRAIGSRRRQDSRGSDVTDSNATSGEGWREPPENAGETTPHDSCWPIVAVSGEAQGWAQRLSNEELGWRSRRRRGSNGSSVTDSNATLIGDHHTIKKKKSFSLCIVTGNGGGRGKLAEFMREDHAMYNRRRMDIFLGQEHHMEREELVEFESARKSEGWKVKGIPATKSVGGGTNGGVLIAVRPRLGLGAGPKAESWELVEGRLMVGYVNALCKGGLYIYCLYLWTSEGLSERNANILRTMGTHAAGHGRPWLAGGDFQIPASAMRGSQWPKELKAEVVATAVPTCTKGRDGSVIDYFVVDKRIRAFFSAPRVYHDGPFKPHHPVEIIATSGWQEATALYLKRCRAFPEKRPIGPYPAPQDWSRIDQMLEEYEGEGKGWDETKKGQSMQEVWKSWGGIAEKELVSHFGLQEDLEKYQGRNEEAHFRTQPVLGWQGTKANGATTPYGAAMRVLNNRLNEVIKLCWAFRAKCGDDKTDQRRNHLGILCKFIGRFALRAITKAVLETHWEERASSLTGWGCTADIENHVNIRVVAAWTAEARAKAEVEEEEAKWRRIRSWRQLAKASLRKRGEQGPHMDQRTN